MTLKKRKSKTGKQLGPFASRFARHLELGLECFSEKFSDFHPYQVHHEKHGNGLLFSQLKECDYGPEQASHYAVIAFEHGILWSTGALIYFSNEQPPEAVALLFLAALTRESPVGKPSCESCKTEDIFVAHLKKTDDEDNCMRPFIPGFDD